jgi:hypothetical protein
VDFVFLVIVIALVREIEALARKGCVASEINVVVEAVSTCTGAGHLEADHEHPTLVFAETSA